MKRLKKLLISGIALAVMLTVPAQAGDCAFYNRQTQTVSQMGYLVTAESTIKAATSTLTNTISCPLSEWSSSSRWPKGLSDLNNVQSVTACSSSEVGAAVLQDGILWTWGDNKYNVTGQLDYKFDASLKQIMSDVVTVSAGDNHMVAVKNDNTLWGWGLNYSGALGESLENQAVPRKIMDDVQAAAAGPRCTIFIKTDGSLWVMGNSELGSNRVEYYGNQPVKIMDHAIAASAGDDFFAAIKDDHSLWMWGRNYNGQLGNGTYTDTREPVKVMEQVQAVCAGNGGTTILKTDGNVYYCGFENTVKPGINKPIELVDEACAIAANRYVLKKDGTLLKIYINSGDISAYGGAIITCAENAKLPERIRSKPSNWAASEVLTAQELGILPDDFSDVYREAITRKEFCYLAAAMLEKKTEKNILAIADEKGVTVDYNAFSDCDDPTIAAISALGIVTGYDGRFSPDDSLTREQAATMLTRLAKLLGMNSPNSSSVNFKDYSQVASWAKEGVQFITSCQSEGQKVMNGTASNIFSPQGTYSREQAIITFKRLYKAL